MKINKVTYVVSSSDGSLYGPFDLLSSAVDWAEQNDEMLGDWNVEEVVGGDP